MGTALPFANAHDHELLLALLEAVPDGIVVLDRQGQIRLVNRQTERLFGYSRQELLGKPLETLLPERLRALHERHRQGHTLKPRTRPMGSGLALIGRRKDGSEFPIAVGLSPVPRQEGAWVISTVRDITHRERAEENSASSTPNWSSASPSGRRSSRRPMRT